MRADEKNGGVIGQYDITVWDSYRFRGAVYYRTEQGLLMLRSREAKEARVAYEESIKCVGQAKGFSTLDRGIQNIEGNYVTEGDYGETFLLRHWTEGEECDLENIEAAVRAAEGLAHFHAAMHGCPVQEEYVQEGIEEGALRRIREVRKMETYLRKRKQKTPFESKLQEVLPEFRVQAEGALRLLSECSVEELGRTSIADGLLAHGNYGSHTVLLLRDGVFVSDFEHARIGIQVVDLYYLMRKTLEKHSFVGDVPERLLAAYESGRGLSVAERQVLYCLLATPEKFLRICNRYFNRKKSWIPGKNAQKLQMVLEQEPARQEMLARIKGCLF